MLKRFKCFATVLTACLLLAGLSSTAPVLAGEPLKKTMKRGAEKTGRAVKNGAEWTGKKVKQGYRASSKGVRNAAGYAGRAVKQGARKTRDTFSRDEKADNKKSAPSASQEAKPSAGAS
jgi:ribosomal protein S17E